MCILHVMTLFVSKKCSYVAMAFSSARLMKLHAAICDYCQQTVVMKRNSESILVIDENIVGTQVK